MIITVCLSYMNFDYNMKVSAMMF